MASLLLNRPLLTGTAIFSTSFLLLHPQTSSFSPFRFRQPRQILLCDASASPLSSSSAFPSEKAQTPLRTQSGWNPAALKQVSAGSILGLVGGVAVSLFSKPLALILGMVIFGVQFIESRGIHVIPYSFLQRRFQNTNVRSLIQDNVALKLSFGLTFALAAFAEF